MANGDVEDVTKQLAKAQVEEDFELSFAGRGLKLDSENDAEDIIIAIRNFRTLRVLKLEGNTFGIDAAKGIGKALESHKELERALWKDMFTGRLKSEIPQALRFLSAGLMLANAQLKELDLSDNAFGPVGVEAVSELLKSRTCYTLQELRLNNNGLGINGGKLLAESLLALYANSKNDNCPLNLKTFICGRNRLENAGVQAIAEVFLTIDTLEEVQMPQNSVFYEGIDALAKGLKHNPNLKHLNLNDNIFTEKGAKAMSTVLPKLQNLEIINFGDCLLKSEGAQVIANSLKDGHLQLKELHIGYNEIDQEAAIVIVEALKNKSKLLKLDLNGNQLGKDGCRDVENLLLEMEKSDILGSLSDDEGDDEGDTKDDYEDEEEDEEIEGEDEDEKENVDINKLRNTENKENAEIKTEKDTVIPEKSTPSEFLRTPSPGRLLGLGNDRASALLEEATKDPRGEEKYIDTFIKVASIVSPNNEVVKQAAYECADSLLSKGFQESEESGAASTFANTFLVYLGLIKSEDKRVKPPADLSGALTVLEYAVRQPYFSRLTKEMLQVFLSRFHEAVEHTGEIKHRLMQTLYQY